MTDEPANLVTKDGKPITKGRIRPALDTAIRLIEEHGYTIADAAKSVEYRTHSLVQALNKPHVRAYRIHVRQAWRNSETVAAWQTMAKLARGAASEDVQHKSAKFLIEQAAAAEQRLPGEVRQLVQIINHGTVHTGQLPSQQSSGVYEAEPYQPPALIPSNSDIVGRAENVEEDDDEPG